jgi:Fibronectin type III domain
MKLGLPTTSSSSTSSSGSGYNAADEVTVRGDTVRRDMSDLLAGTVYTFRVCAVSRLGRGEWSQESDLVCTDTDVPTQCTRPLVESVQATAITVSFLAPEPTLPQMQTHYFDVHIAGGAFTSSTTNSSSTGSSSSGDAMPKISVTWEEAKLAGQQFLNSLNSTKKGKSISHKSNVLKLKHNGEQALDSTTATATDTADTAASSDSRALVLRSNSADAAQLHSVTEQPVHSKEHTNNTNNSSNSNSSSNSSSTQRVHDLRHKPFHVLLCATVQHLQPGTYYRLAVCGVNAQGSGALSAYSHSARTPAVVPGTCPVPTVAPVNGNTQAVEVHWQAGSDGGSAVTSFALNLCRVDAVSGAAAVHEQDDAVCRQEIKCKRTEVARVIEGLTAGCWYSCRVRALNAEGKGAWSELSQPCR